MFSLLSILTVADHGNKQRYTLIFNRKTLVIRPENNGIESYINYIVIRIHAVLYHL
jgi:hypothetical protein